MSKQVSYTVVINVEDDKADLDDFQNCFESMLAFGADEASNIDGAFRHKIISIVRNEVNQNE